VVSEPAEMDGMMAGGDSSLRFASFGMTSVGYKKRVKINAVGFADRIDFHLITFITASFRPKGEKIYIQNDGRGLGWGCIRFLPTFCP